MVGFCLDLGDWGVNPRNAGSKAFLLSVAAGTVPVPRGFVVTTEAYDVFVGDNNIREIIHDNVQQFLGGKIPAEEASARIKSAIHKGRIRDEIVKEIRDRASGLRPPFAVRSSSTAEDSKRFSFAGLYDSFLNVGYGELERRVKDVYASLFNRRVLEYARRNGIDIEGMKMGVLIQEMVRGDKFGVGFYFNDAGADVFIIESAVGDPSGVTAGRGSLDTYVVRNNEVCKYPARMNVNSLFDFEINEITVLMRKLKGVVLPLDVEWAVEGGRLLLLQLRPLTRDVPVPRGKQLLNGLPASPGRVCGKAVVWKGRRDSLEKGKDRILVAEEVEIGDVEVVKDFGGVVLEVSGITAHASILARVLGIPCVVGVDGITKIVRAGERICIDGSTGEITFMERESFSIGRKYRPVHVNPADLRYFRWGKDMVLYVVGMEHVVVYHPECGDRLKEICQQLRRKVEKPLVDGGADVWYGYGIILEMGQLDEGVYRDFMRGLEAVRSADRERISETVKKYVEKILYFYEKARRSFGTYRATGDRKELRGALQNVDMAYAYWRIAGYCMLYDYAGNVASRMGAPEREEFLSFVGGLQRDERLVEVGRMVTALVEEVLCAVRDDLGIEYSEYTSELALLSSVAPDSG